MDDILAPRFIDPVAARKHLEALRWPDGAECPHCQLINATAVSGGREGLYQCNSCREQFTVTVGTVFERSKIALNKWLLCNHLLCASKKGMSALQISRMLGVTYKTAWFMCHRLREAMKDDGSPEYAKTTANCFHVEAKDQFHVLYCDIPAPDPSVSVIAGELLYQLRSALDLVVCDLARLSGATDTSDCYFPMARDQAYFESPKSTRKIRKLSPERQALIKELRPYADEDLMALNALANTDRHDDLIHAIPSASKTEWGMTPSHAPPFTLQMQIRKPHPLETGRIELARVPLGSPIKDFGVKTTFTLVLTAPEVLGRPALPTIDAIIKRVTDIGQTIEAAESL